MDEKIKNIVSFSLWGNHPNYVIGAIRNAELMKDIYPGWTCRIYIDKQTVPYNIKNKLEHLGSEIVEMDGRDWSSTMWRFLPASDDDVGIMISRDVDSRITKREKIAVDEWLSSDKNFHIIRDHPHHQFYILAGMWGIRNKILKNMKNLISQYKIRDYNNKQTDQEFLRDIIYPLIKNDSLIHDEFHFFKEENVKKILHTRYNNEHVGEYIDCNEQPSVWHKEELGRYFNK